jgi:hypothetical protein
LISIGIILVLFIGLGVLVRVIFPPGIPINDATPEIKIISAPTSTLEGVNNIPQNQPSPTDSLELNGVRVGTYVQVMGTSGTGLRLRSDPGSKGKTIALASDSEVFLITDGPQIVDEITWWMLEAPYQTNRRGWAAADYLSPLSTPPPN